MGVNTRASFHSLQIGRRSGGVGSECGCIPLLEEVNGVDRGDSEGSLVDGRAAPSLVLSTVVKLSTAFHVCEHYHSKLLITRLGHTEWMNGVFKASKVHFSRLDGGETRKDQQGRRSVARL